MMRYLRRADELPAVPVDPEYLVCRGGYVIVSHIKLSANRVQSVVFTSGRGREVEQVVRQRAIRHRATAEVPRERDLRYYVLLYARKQDNASTGGQGKNFDRQGEAEGGWGWGVDINVTILLDVVAKTIIDLVSLQTPGRSGSLAGFAPIQVALF